MARSVHRGAFRRSRPASRLRLTIARSHGIVRKHHSARMLDMPTVAIVTIISSFLASAVEFVEAVTIVLAVGVTRQWRSTLAWLATRGGHGQRAAMTPGLTGAICPPS
jgi:hypothetical protein